MPIPVLVLESDRLTRQTLVHMLEFLNHAAVGVESAVAAFAALDSVAFEVLILSLEQSESDGIMLSAEAKALYKQIKVVAVGGSHPPAMLGRFVDAFLQKPFSLQQIDETIKRVTGG